MCRTSPPSSPSEEAAVSLPVSQLSLMVELERLVILRRWMLVFQHKVSLDVCDVVFRLLWKQSQWILQVQIIYVTTSWHRWNS